MATLMINSNGDALYQPVIWEIHTQAKYIAKLQCIDTVLNTCLYGHVCMDTEHA